MLWRILPLLLLVLVPCLVYVGYELDAGQRPGLPLDDSWIHAAFARTLVEGHPFRLHPQDPPVQGSSAPLWTFLLAGLQAPLHGHLSAYDTAVVTAFLLGVLCAFATLSAFYSLLRVVNVSAKVAWLTTILFAIQPRWLWGTLSGLEVPLYTFLIVLALRLHIGARQRGESSFAALPLAALAGWARPECFVYPVILALDSLIFPTGVKRRLGDARGILVAVSLMVIYLLFHLNVHGRPLPTTFYVKAVETSSLGRIFGGDVLGALSHAGTNAVRQLVADLAFVPGHVLALLPVALLGIVAARSQGATILVLVPILFPLLQGALTFVQPENQFGRYFLHLVPPLWILGALGLEQLRAPWATPPRRLQPILLALVACVGLAFLARHVLATSGASALWHTTRFVYFNSLDIPSDVLSASFEFLTTTRGMLTATHVTLAFVGWAAFVVFSRESVRVFAAWSLLFLQAAFTLVGFATVGPLLGRNVHETGRISVAAARWVARNVDPQARVACHDLGAMAYFGEHRLLDLQGLGTPRVLDLPRDEEGRRDLSLLLREEHPEVYVGFLEWHVVDLQKSITDPETNEVLWRELPGADLAAFVQRHTLATFSLPSTVTLGGTTMIVWQIPWKPRRRP